MVRQLCFFLLAQPHACLIPEGLKATLHAAYMPNLLPGLSAQLIYANSLLLI